VCLARSASGVLFAMLDECSHENVPLSDGWVYEELIECPLHNSVFDLTTGNAVSEPATEPLTMFEVDLDGDDIVVDIEFDRQA
jgi:3-phenylpropionate/trans-cinnamate dioxygenase ferredoxin subunit